LTYWLHRSKQNTWLDTRAGTCHSARMCTELPHIYYICEEIPNSPLLLVGSSLSFCIEFTGVGILIHATHSQAPFNDSECNLQTCVTCMFFKWRWIMLKVLMVLSLLLQGNRSLFNWLDHPQLNERTVASQLRTIKGLQLLPVS